MILDSQDGKTVRLNGKYNIRELYDALQRLLPSCYSWCRGEGCPICGRGRYSANYAVTVPTTDSAATCTKCEPGRPCCYGHGHY